MQCQGWDAPCGRQDATRRRQNTSDVDEDRVIGRYCAESVRRRLMRIGAICGQITMRV